jgi:hypothetical protein
MNCPSTDASAPDEINASGGASDSGMEGLGASVTGSQG